VVEYVSENGIIVNCWVLGGILEFLQVQIWVFSDVEHLVFFQVLMCRLTTSYWPSDNSGETTWFWG